MRVWGSLLLAALMCVVGALAAKQPLIAVLMTGALLFALIAYLHPRRLALTLAFLTAAFPKAGVKVGDFPFPVFLFGLGIALLLLPALSTPRERGREGVRLLLFLYLGWIAFRMLVLAPDAGAAGVAAFAAWAAIPATYLVLATRVESVDPSWLRAIENGFLVAVAFALVQWQFGIEETKIPGLTIAWGDSYADKHNVIYTASGPDFSKFMSTYQNGNIFGVCAAVFVVLAAARIIKRQASGHDVLLFAGGALAVELSGSRTGILAAVAGIALLLLGSGFLTRKLGIVLGAALVGYIALAAVPGLAERYSYAAVFEEGGDSRMYIWHRALYATTLKDWLFGARAYMPLEGGPGVLLQIGAVGILLLVALVLVATKQRREWLVPFAAVAAAATVDYSYALFPTWFLPAAAAAAMPFRAPTMPRRGDREVADASRSTSGRR